MPKIAGISDIVVEEVNYRGKAEKEKRVDDSPPVISEEIMNLTLEELRKSIANRNWSFTGVRFPKTRPAIMKRVERRRETKNETLMSCLWSI